MLFGERDIFSFCNAFTAAELLFSLPKILILCGVGGDVGVGILLLVGDDGGVAGV